MGYTPDIPNLQVGYKAFTNHLLNSWDYRVVVGRTKKQLGGSSHDLSVVRITPMATSHVHGHLEKVIARGLDLFIMGINHILIGI